MVSRRVWGVQTLRVKYYEQKRGHEDLDGTVFCLGLSRKSLASLLYIIIRGAWVTLAR